jgi:hypothetical protein
VSQSQQLSTESPTNFQQLQPLILLNNYYSVEVEVTLQLTVIQSVCLRVEHNLELVTRYYFLSEGCFLKVVVLFLWGALSDERTVLQFAAQSLNGSSLAEPLTILCCLI